MRQQRSGECTMRFQVVFRTDGGDVSELHDNSEAEPHINGVLLLDGLIFTHLGHEWLVARDDHADGMQRFVCTQVRPVTSRFGGVRPDRAPRSTKRFLGRMSAASRSGWLAVQSNARSSRPRQWVCPRAVRATSLTGYAGRPLLFPLRICVAEFVVRRTFHLRGRPLPTSDASPALLWPGSAGESS